ncbi:MAG: AMP-binding protein, partial [Bacteroidales bacterium]|nr:AMP-binding protein [Bacteroidales bacterium]
MAFESLNKIYERSFRENWDRPALSNYQGVTLHYREMAQRIAKLHIMYEQCGLQKGDKIAICSRNQAHWAVCFISAISYGAVAVPILHEFKPGNIHHLVNHSEAKVLFVDNVVWEGLSESEMPGLHAVIQINNFQLLYARDEGIRETRAHLNESFGKKYPMDFAPEDVVYHEDKAEE